MASKRAPEQLILRHVEAHAFRSQRASALAYMRQYRAQYLTWAQMICPDVTNAQHVWERLLFAVLSSRERFERTCKAFVVCAKEGQDAIAHYSLRNLSGLLAKEGIVYHRSKAKYARVLAQQNPLGYVKQADEPWAEYRIRLTNILGLGIVKSSFAACLLYPLTADLACIDTWMHRVMLGRDMPQHRINSEDYLRAERRVRRWARIVNMPTFVAQWAIWDHTRRRAEDHGVLRFPGGHKDEVQVLW